MALLLGALGMVAGQPPTASTQPATRPTSRPAEPPPVKWPHPAGKQDPAVWEKLTTTQPNGSAKPGMDLTKIECAACHSCDTPTKESPCLRMCPRSVAEIIADAAHEKLPQKVILLHAFEWEKRRFMPVPFNHKLHADMAGMAGGCEVCHHHTTPGKLHPPCKECHKAEFAKTSAEDLRMPSLKGAYHRQCMGCHRDWSHGTKCGLCHLPKSGVKAEPTKPEEVLTKGDIAGHHPPIEVPDEVLYKTAHDDGPNVMFRHKEHVDSYGYECERCHREENCSRCHEQTQKPREDLAHVKRDTHEECTACHKDDLCERCHSHEDHPPPKPFDHALTGFSLEKYHGRLTCRACHKRLLFLRKLESDCSFCHQDWDIHKFDHGKVTGLALDETHASIECAECHVDRKFIKPPVCEGCHDETTRYPAKRPGKRQSDG